MSDLPTPPATQTGNGMLLKLEQLVLQSCECKLRTHCPDKTSADCLKHRNLYAEAMQARRTTSK